MHGTQCRKTQTNAIKDVVIPFVLYCYLKLMSLLVTENQLGPFLMILQERFFFFHV